MMLRGPTVYRIAIALFACARTHAHPAPVEAQSLPSPTIRDAHSLNENLMTRFGNVPGDHDFTRVQRMQPTPWQRNVNYDGTAHLDTGIGAQLVRVEAGHSSEGAWTSTIEGQVNLATAAWIGQVPGLSLPADMPWTIGLAYNSVAETSTTGGSLHGPGWTQIAQPELFLYSQANDPQLDGIVGNAGDILYIVFGTGRYAAYARTEDGSNLFVGVNGVGGIVTQYAPTDTTPELWELRDQLGQQFWFFGEYGPTGVLANPLGDHPNGEWQLWRKVSTDGSAAYVGHATDPWIATQQGYTTDGRVNVAIDSAGRHFTYHHDAAGLIAKVVVADGPSSPMIAEVVYTYFNGGNYTAPFNAPHPPLALRSSITRK